jgi:hypothetical protein
MLALHKAKLPQQKMIYDTMVFEKVCYVPKHLKGEGVASFCTAVFEHQIASLKTLKLGDSWLQS